MHLRTQVVRAPPSGFALLGDLSGKQVTHNGLGPGLGTHRVASMGDSRDRGRNVGGGPREAAWQELAGEVGLVLAEQVGPTTPSGFGGTAVLWGQNLHPQLLPKGPEGGTWKSRRANAPRDDL